MILFSFYGLKLLALFEEALDLEYIIYFYWI